MSFKVFSEKSASKIDSQIKEMSSEMDELRKKVDANTSSVEEAHESIENHVTEESSDDIVIGEIDTEAQ